MNRRMSVPLARSLVDGELDITHAGLALPAARTIVAQAEQIERLQRAVNYAITYSLQDAVDLVVDGVLHSEDMGPTG